MHWWSLQGSVRPIRYTVSVADLGGGAVAWKHYLRCRNVLFNDALNTFYYGYMASDIWLRTILIVREETRCRHIGYSFRLAARVLLYAPSHRQDSTYHGLCYTSRGALAGTRNSSMGPPHEGSIRRPIAPRSYISLLLFTETMGYKTLTKLFHLLYSYMSVNEKFCRR